jgi:glycosyltransferase involved in cell wall biosynthesis
VRVLYVEHGPLVSGGQRSLLELLRGLPADVDAEVACPPGPLADAVARLGVPVSYLRGTEGSFKLHPVHTTRMAADLAGMARAVRRRALEGRFDVVHANSVRAGLVLAAAFGPRRTGRPVRTVVHVRDSLPAGAVGKTVRQAIARTADRVVAISAHTARSFGAGHPVVVHNPVDGERFRPAADRAPDAQPTLAVIAQITPWKGQDLAIRTLAGVRQRGIDARLLIVGEAKFVSTATRFDNRAYEEELHRLAAELGVTDSVEFTGEREDVPEILTALDAVLVPSWEEPFGRTIIEAMACGVPVIATDRGGPPEIITDGVDGHLLPPRDAGPWIETTADLLTDPARRKAMGRTARATALERFATHAHVAQIVALYMSEIAPAPASRQK